MKLEDWYYSVWAKWNEKVFGSTLNVNNFIEDGRMNQQDSFIYVVNGITTERAPINTEDKYYVKMVKGNEYFLLPKRFLDKLPIIPIEYLQIKLKRSDSQLWNFITKSDSLAVPVMKSMSFRELLIRFNPVEHSSPDDYMFLKFIAFSTGIKIAVCGGAGNGKNANLTLMRQILNNVAPKVKKPTQAKFYRTLYFNDYINIDEITSWKNSEVQIIEELVAEFGDEAPDMDKFSLDKSRSMEMLNNINQKSLTFTFNPYSKFNPYHLHDKFVNWDKMSDRYPVFWMEGKVLSNIPKPRPSRSKKLMEENFKEMCDIVSNIYYYRKYGHKHLHNYDRTKCGLKERHLNNITGLLDVIDMYSNSQQEFDEWMQFINISVYKYKQHVDKNKGLRDELIQHTEEVFIR